MDQIYSKNQSENVKSVQVGSGDDGSQKTSYMHKYVKKYADYIKK